MNRFHCLCPSVLPGLLVCLLLGLAGCASTANSPMPAGWPALHSMARVSELDGIYRGDSPQRARLNQVFFPQQPMTNMGLDGYRLTTVPAGLQVEALARDTVLGTRVIPVDLDAGAVTFERKDSGPEGSYRSRATVQVNAAGELVVAYHRTPTNFLGGSSTTEWMRLSRAAP